MSTPSNAHLLRGWLGQMPQEFRRALLTKVAWRRFPAGKALYFAGDPPGGIFGVAEGVLGATLSLSSPDAPVFHVAHAGLWFGEGSLLSDEPRRISVVAITSAHVAYVPLGTLQAILGEHPQWWRHIAQLTLANCDILHKGLADLMIHDPRRRSAAILLRLDGGYSQDDVRPQLPISQQDFAAIANLARATVNPILRRFAEQRLIEIGYRSVTILNARGLRRIVDDELFA